MSYKQFSSRQDAIASANAAGKGKSADPPKDAPSVKKPAVQPGKAPAEATLPAES